MKVYEKRNRYYLDMLRIIAILLVMYNHCAAFVFFQTEHGIRFEISLLLLLLCKVAVPIFFMISGTLLLGKKESIKELFQKRILKCVLALVVLSFMHYMKLAVRGEVVFSIIDFLVSLPQKVVFLILCLCLSTLFQRPGVGGAHEPL